jgi:hypothetical protein
MDDVAAFTYQQALARGMTPGFLRSPHLDAPFHGVRSMSAPQDGRVRARVYATKMRADAAFTGISAALLWGIPLPMWLDVELVHVAAPHGRARPGGRGVRGSLYMPGSVEVVELDGLRVLSPADTWASLAAHLGLADLVAAGDFLATPRFGSRRAAAVSLEELDEVARRRRFRGVTVAREAAALVRIGPLSRPESLSRVLAISGGLPEPECNVAISPLVTFDLAWPRWRLGYDYHGSSHRSPTQHAKDVSRSDLARRSGWESMQAAATDLFDAPFELLGRMRSRLAERGAPVGRLDVRKVALARR